MKKRIGIYHYQYYRGACKLCYRHFIQEMVESYEKCHDVAKKIYGDDCEFFHYTDFGQYDSNNVDRPSFGRLKKAIENDELDVIMCYGLNQITINETILIDFYKEIRAKGLEFITAGHGLDAMKYMDAYIQKQNVISKQERIRRREQHKKVQATGFLFLYNLSKVTSSFCFISDIIHKIQKTKVRILLIDGSFCPNGYDENSIRIIAGSKAPANKIRKKDLGPQGFGN